MVGIVENIITYLQSLGTNRRINCVITVHANHARKWPIGSRPLWGHDGLGLSDHSVVFTCQSIISNHTLHILVYNIYYMVP